MLDRNLAFGLVTTALLLAVGHWLLAPHLLHRLIAYTYGVACILAGTGIWLSLIGQTRIWVGLVGFAVIGGATVCMAYGVDWALNAWLRQRHDQ